MVRILQYGSLRFASLRFGSLRFASVCSVNGVLGHLQGENTESMNSLFTQSGDDEDRKGPEKLILCLSTYSILMPHRGGVFFKGMRRTSGKEKTITVHVPGCALCSAEPI